MTKKSEAFTAAMVKKIAPHSQQLAVLSELLDELERAIITATVEGRTDGRSLDALAADLRLTIKGWKD